MQIASMIEKMQWASGFRTLGGSLPIISENALARRSGKCPVIQLSRDAPGSKNGLSPARPLSPTPWYQIVWKPYPSSLSTRPPTSKSVELEIALSHAPIARSSLRIGVSFGRARSFIIAGAGHGCSCQLSYSADARLTVKGSADAKRVCRPVPLPASGDTPRVVWRLIAAWPSKA